MEQNTRQVVRRKNRGKGVQAGLAIVLLVSCWCWGGCETLRFAPGEAQKQNAYLHYRTVSASAQQAQQEQVSATLQDLTRRASSQSEAILAYYGLPREVPESETVEEMLNDSSTALTEQARTAALQRPDPWNVADNLLELGMAVAAVFGGVLGTRAAQALRTARQKSDALREVVQGNELFKQAQPQVAEAFKQAQAGQSNTTRQQVAALKQPA